MGGQDGKKIGFGVPRYYLENEREVFACRKILESLVESPKSFGEQLQQLYYEFTGNAIPEIKIFYDPNTLHEYCQIRVSRMQYKTFLDGYWFMERYLPYLGSQVDSGAIALYRKIGEILSDGFFSGKDYKE